MAAETIIKKIKYVCDCCSANFTVDEDHADRVYEVKYCPFCGNQYLEVIK